MYYVSTRDKNARVTAQQAISMGLSRDGGLFAPTEIPRLSKDDITALAGMDYIGRASHILGLYLTDFTAEELNAFANAAYGGGKFDHPAVAPICSLGNNHILELWHGPTSAFKDMALQMLPHLLTASLKKTGEQKTCCILTATSGDTGKAALEGFCDVPGTRIVVFYPENGVSRVQQLQMITQKGENVAVFAVKGNFDDAQTGVKTIFSDVEIREEIASNGYFFSSANSINLGRILPQVIYYVSAYCGLVANGTVKNGDAIDVCVPTGNFGNILAAYYAKKMGVNIGKLICASNSNNVLTDFITTGVYDKRRPFHMTTSPSMDILVSSNLERLLYHLSGEDDVRVSGWMKQLSEEGVYEIPGDMKSALGELFAAGFATDDEAAATIKKVWDEQGYLMDTHTAVAYTVMERYRAATGSTVPAVVASTASPYKFCDSVLAALGEKCGGDGLALVDTLEKVSGLKVPEGLAALKNASIRFETVLEKQDMAKAVVEYLG
ncbi:MAG: threonine synthase [Oscillospiraceae bacterium]|nr:threonine synthase [Oscillospiraceae bacterium]